MTRVVDPPGTFVVGGCLAVVAGALLAGVSPAPAATLALGGILLLVTRLGLSVQAMGS